MVWHQCRQQLALATPCSRLAVAAEGAGLVVPPGDSFLLLDLLRPVMHGALVNLQPTRLAGQAGPEWNIFRQLSASQEYRSGEGVRQFLTDHRLVTPQEPRDPLSPAARTGGRHLSHAYHSRPPFDFAPMGLEFRLYGWRVSNENGPSPLVLAWVLVSASAIKQDLRR
jgi:hypothetical protein